LSLPWLRVEHRRLVPAQSLRMGFPADRAAGVWSSRAAPRDVGGIHLHQLRSRRRTNAGPARRLSGTHGPLPDQRLLQGPSPRQGCGRELEGGRRGLPRVLPRGCYPCAGGSVLRLRPGPVRFHFRPRDALCRASRGDQRGVERAGAPFGRTAGEARADQRQPWRSSGQRSGKFDQAWADHEKLPRADGAGESRE